MKKRIKLLGLILALLVFFTGCGKEKYIKNKVLSTAFDKMQVKEDMVGYELDLRIYGIYKDKNVNEILRIEKYKDDITSRNIGLMLPIEEEEIEEIYNIYKDKKIYEIKDNKAREINEAKYLKPELYLEALKKATKVTVKKDLAIGETSYKTYELLLKPSDTEKMLSDTILNNIKLKEEVTAIVYINKDGYVYDIKFQINDNLNISANYFKYNATREANLPM